MTAKKLIPVIAAVFFFTACTKNDTDPSPAMPVFGAVVNGIPTNFTNSVTARSEKNAGGGYDLKISGENKLTGDSSILITFTIPDFTATGLSAADHQLNTNFKGNFIEWKTVPGTTNGKYHYYQQGQLSIQLDQNKRLKGTFHFKYFLFDKLGNKTGEVEVVNGGFTDVVLQR